MPTTDYDPDPGTLPGGTLATALLSQRDVAATVPINFVTRPAINLTAACFANDLYDDDPTRKCLSNILAAGFSRIHLDVYWNNQLAQWSLCPVLVPSPLSTNASTTSATNTSALASSTALATSTLASSAMIARDLRERRTDSSLSAASSTSSSSSTANQVPGSPGLYQLGQYKCTATDDLSLVTAVYADYLAATNNNLNATIHYMIINLHDATTLIAPSNGTNSTLPSADPVSTSLDTALLPFLYTPTDLRTDRANLNESWLSAVSSVRPDTSYFTLTVEPDGILSTPDGWPSGGYAELISAKRLLVGFGIIDHASDQYNTAVDESYIFPSGALTSSPNVTFTSDGAVSASCFYDSTTSSLSSVNDSFATAASLPSSLTESTLSLTTCGISPLLTTNLTTASYPSLLRSTIWSWLPTADTSLAPSSAHCAAMNLSTPLARWLPAPCAAHHPRACRNASNPQHWSLAPPAPHAGPSPCPPDTAFAAPRTALENAHLASAARAHASNDPLVWLALNDLDVPGCWVQGVDAACPYAAGEAAAGAVRDVVVPVVVAVLIFAIAGLTVFVKCAANRAGRRRARSGDAGGEYEGVPS